MGMRYPPMPLQIISAEERLPMDEHGNIDWHMTWIKELRDLQEHTAQQEKANQNQDWYRMMFFRLRSGLMSPFDPSMMVQGAPPPHPMAHPEHQEVQQEGQVHE
jgi:forkhead box protein J2/3